MNKCPQCLTVLSEPGEVCEKCGFSILEDITRTFAGIGLDETQATKILSDEKMTPEKWQKIKGLFEAAQEIRHEKRQSFLANACSNDEELKSEVEKLLDSFENADSSFLEEPAEKEVASQILEQKTKALNNQTTGEVQPDAFVAGTVLDKRYRIIGLLGKGGMGEVYKAEDLTLGQTVALKFLPDRLAKNEDALKRFIGEVRNARQVAHENVCKVYDIGEINGNRYLSMEFIDGDDLSMLLRRIGRFSSDRAVEIASQICFGLNAIHKAGILHRDLKPANVIINSKGVAKITDFGIAGLEQHVQGAESRVGTPAYMSPEQITGREVTKKSDIYSLGLLLYEIFTGKQAVKGESINEIIEIHESQTPTNPSEFVENIDPIVEKVINRCLEKNPADRPKSALQVALALPGGNPLEAALAAGETPSPDMIAAAPKKGALKPYVALLLTLGILAGFIFLAVHYYYYQITNIIPFEKSPEILAERAKTMVRNFGYTEPPADSRYFFENDRSFMDYAEKNKSIANPVERLRSGQPYRIYFLYRQSPRLLIFLGGFKVDENDPPLEIAGMVSVFLDTRGRLIKFVAVPDQVMEKTEASETAATTDWKKLFDEAELDTEKFREVEPNWTPPVFADEQKAWEGTLADFEDIPIRIEAAAYNGKPVYFDIVYPWDKSKRQMKTEQTNLGFIYSDATFALILCGAVWLAIRNIRSGRADLKGAGKLTVFVFVSLALSFAINADHIASRAERRIITWIISFSLYYAVLTGIFYVAIEPYARRYWPEMLVSWNRLLKGDLLDPMIGRDILIGGVFAAIFMLTMTLGGSYGEIYVIGSFDSANLHSWLGTLANLLAELTFTSLIYPLIMPVQLVLLFAVFRNVKISIVVFLIIIIGEELIIGILENGNLEWISIISTFISMLLLITLLRFGLVTLIFSFFYAQLFHKFPLTFDVSSHLFPGTMIVTAAVVGLTIYGYYTSTAGKSVFSRGLLDDKDKK